MPHLLQGLLHLMRPLEWSKSLGNMAIAAVTAGFVASAQLDPLRFLIGFASVAMLWSGLYTLNDYTDRKADALHQLKRKRPIPSGAVPAGLALVLALVLIAASFAIAYCLNSSLIFMLCLLAMLVNQLLYSLKPFSLKKRPVLDLISGSLVNPIFRFYSGWVLFVPAFNAPLLILAFILGIQFGGFGLYRMASRSHEERIGLKSSVVRFQQKRLRRLAYLAIAIGGVSYLIATLTILPISYLFLGLAMLLPAPLYISAMKRPEEMNIKRMYWLVYLHFLVFVACFVLLYLYPVF